MVIALLVGLAILAVVFGGAVIATAHARSELSPRPEAIALGFVTNFFDTLGIGSYAPTTAWLKLRRMVPDSYIPAVLNVGHAIPTLGGKVRPLSDRPLSECHVGETVVVQGVSDEDAGRLRELERRGLLPGTRIEVVAESKFEGPIAVRIKGRRATVPLGLARAVFVEALR